MERNPIDEGRISENSLGIGTVTLEMVWERARELAIINGRGPGEVLDSDLAQAWRELTGGVDESPQDEVIEELPEWERWDPIPGSFGNTAPKVPPPDEPAENARLFQEGLDDAEHDEMLRASMEAARRDMGA